MGTRLELAFSPTTSLSLFDIATSLLPVSGSAGTAKSVVLYLSVAEHSGMRLLAATVTDGTHLVPIVDEIAQHLSSVASPVLHQWYSDSLGEAGYAIYKNGTRTVCVDSEVPGEEPLFPRFQEGFREAFPEWAELGPEDVLDLIYSPEATSEEFVLARDGIVLNEPVPYVPAAASGREPSLLSREFAWGRLPRKILRGCAIVFGAVGVLGILAVVAWWLSEVLRG